MQTELQLFRKGGHYIMLTGVKSKDFLVYNIDEFTVTNDPIKGTDLFEIKSSFTSVLKELKSQALGTFHPISLLWGIPAPSF